MYINLDEYQPKQLYNQKYWIKDLGLLEEELTLTLLKSCSRSASLMSQVFSQCVVV